MSQKVDVSIAFYGKPYQAIVTIKTLMLHSRQHIDKIYLSRERKQPHDDYAGIFKIIDYFRNDPDVRLVVQYPYHHLGLGVKDLERAKTDTRWRQSIMYQYALETTDKKYLCIMHNDMLYHGDMIGDMLETFAASPESLAGVGSIGQCWSCPAGPDWGNRCNSYKFEEYVPDKEELLELTAAYDTPRQAIQLDVIRNGRVHILPECRLNEYCAMIDVEKYRKETVPHGEIGCYGGNWGGIDTATIWSHDMYRKGYTFRHLHLENYTTHAPFDGTGSGTKANTSSDIYWNAERNAEKFIEENYGPIRFTGYVARATMLDKWKRNAWLTLIHGVGFAKRLIGK
ncbi:hypothetical protein [Dyadobacter sandarakinus]|uniref:Glycosyl transferase family 2 n=1 Tax=Dyadobacter sandarakinus TaxID=2747268 RepID=A0ABX7I7A8_9BACT|nr:hypothetical protein [Dyadobacter sandarakinus]QRR01996.1 hypothetical protein HWI92_14305 [Dyadobacter sandarakinus]